MDKETPIDLLRLSPEAQQRLLTDLQRASDTSDAVTQRRSHKRHDYRQRSVPALIQHPGGTVMRCIVSSRNLSAGGLSFLHGSFLHTGTACVVFLTKTSGQTVPLRGAVVTCRHVRGHVHEIGLQFQENVDPAEFVAIDVLDAAAESDAEMSTSDAGQAAGPIMLLTADDALAATVTRALQDALRPVVPLKQDADSLTALREQTPGVILLDMRGASQDLSMPALREAAGEVPIIAMAPQADQAPEEADAKLTTDATDEAIRGTVLGLLEVDEDRRPSAAA